MADVLSVGGWIGGRFQVFDVHEGGMSVVYVVNDHHGDRGRSVVAPRRYAKSFCGVEFASAGLRPNAGSGFSLASIRMSCGHIPSRSSKAGRT